MHRRKQPILPRHVVCSRRNRTKRRASQNEFVTAQPNKIGEIGMSAGKLFELYLSLIERRARQQLSEMQSKVSLERFEVEFLAGSDRRCIYHFRSDPHISEAIRYVMPDVILEPSI
jgi:hypothetical protein